MTLGGRLYGEPRNGSDRSYSKSMFPQGFSLAHFSFFFRMCETTVSETLV